MFLDMPLTAQALYFHLAMRADDDGFVNNPKKIQRMIGGNDDDMRLLIAKGYLITFDSGIIAIKHWKVHNYIRNDRYKSTVYIEERELLTVVNNIYHILGENGIPNDIPTVAKLDTQDRLGKDKNRDIEVLAPAPTPSAKKKKPERHKYGEYNNVLLSDAEMEKLKAEIPEYMDYIDRLSGYMQSTGKSYKDHLATIRNWRRADLKKPIRVSAAINMKNEKQWCFDPNQDDGQELPY